MKHQRRWIVSRMLLILALGWVASTPADAATFFQPNVPDFYQHQKIWNGTLPIPYPAAAGFANGNWWEAYEIVDGTGMVTGGEHGGWCATTAWVNALYQTQHTQLIPKLYSRNAAFAAHTWQEQFAYNNEDLAIYAGGGDPKNAGCTFPATMSDYLENERNWLGHEINVYTWDDAAAAGQRVRLAETHTAAGLVSPNAAVPNPAGGNFDSMFDIYEHLLKKKAATLLYLEPGTNTDPGRWWTNFHVVTGSGVETTATADEIIWFADPNDTFRGIGGLEPNDINFAYIGTDVFPDQVANYTRYFIDPADGRTFKMAGGAGLPNYDGVRIAQIWTLVPEPGSLLILAPGMLILLRRRRCRCAVRRNASCRY